MSDEAIREGILSHLRGVTERRFEEVVKEFPPEFMNSKAPNLGYTPWELLEHLRISQWDLLEYVRNPSYKSPSWPDGYWPAPGSRTDASGWMSSVDAFRSDARDLLTIVSDPKVD